MAFADEAVVNLPAGKAIFHRFPHNLACISVSFPRGSSLDSDVGAQPGSTHMLEHVLFHGGDFL